MRTLPNVSLVAEQGSSTPFLVVGDSRFRLEQPDFTALGFRGDRVRLVAPGTLSRFTEKPIGAVPAVRPSEVFFDCPGPPDPFRGWFVNCQPSRSLVQREVLVAGWLYRSRDGSPDLPYVNAANNGIEDVFYNVRLDPVFAHRMYGPGGLSLRMDGVRYPGNPPDATPLPFAAGPPSDVDNRPTNTYNSWFLPGSVDDVHGELNSWHVNHTGSIGHAAIVGRGPAPADWIAPFAIDRDAWFPFHPLNPDGGPRDLGLGDYVLMRGPLWEDHLHDPFAWDSGLTRHHGWLEMHPIDWVVRVREPLPSAHVTGWRNQGLATTDPVAVDDWISPSFSPGRGRRLAVRSVEEDDDRRPGCSVPGSVRSRQTTVGGEVVHVELTVAPAPSGEGRWKGSWLVSYSEIDDRDRIWVDGGLPPGAVPDGNEEWTWVTDPAPYSRTRAHRSALAPGVHQHYFGVDVTSGMPVGVGDLLVAAVFLDPAAPPDEVMLQWLTADAGWEHRAFWGVDLIPWGISGTASRMPMGPLPFSGEWTRLDVPAASVGLEGATVTGLAFTLSGGLATWDYAGRREAVPPSGRLTTTVTPRSVVVGTRTVHINARDAGNGSELAGRVLLQGQDVAATRQPFTREYPESGPVRFDVRVPGYPLATASLTVREEDDPRG